jgi:glycogen debranching enzyme
MLQNLLKKPGTKVYQSNLNSSPKSASTQAGANNIAKYNRTTPAASGVLAQQAVTGRAQAASLSQQAPSPLAQKIIKKTNLSKPEHINLIKQLTSQMSGNDDENLEYALAVKDGKWLESVIKNPVYHTQDKVDAIKRISKKPEESYIIKNGNLFFNSTDQGNVDARMNQSHTGETRALGLLTAVGDGSYLDNYMLSAKSGKNDLELKSVSAKEDHNQARYELQAKGLKLKRHQLINRGGFREQINYESSGFAKKELKLNVSSIFKDVFGLRRNENLIGAKQTSIEKISDNQFRLSTKVGADTYSLMLRMPPEQAKKLKITQDPAKNGLELVADLGRSGKGSLEFELRPMINGQALVKDQLQPIKPNYINFDASLKALEPIPRNQVEIKASGALKNAGQIISSNLTDVNTLVSYQSVNGKPHQVISAGLPRFAHIFGRDQLQICSQTSPLLPQLTRDVVLTLANYQGKSFAEAKKAEPNLTQELYTKREEEHGKILHEMSTGVATQQNKLPYSPYYGTIDATPQFLNLISKYYAWSGDQNTVQSLDKNIKGALEWIDNNSNSEGFLTGKSGDTLKNQGWKDSGESMKFLIDKNTNKIKNPKYPLALAEIQGYVYQAKTQIADIYDEMGRTQEAKKLRSEAAKLKANFNKKFITKEGFVATAIGADGKQVPDISTNGAEALATGIVDNKHHKNILKLTFEKLDTGWGFRTLTKDNQAYNPLDYQRGSVWAYNTANVARNMPTKQAAKVWSNLLNAADTFGGRLPELFGGFDRQSGDKKIDIYPEACMTQAWSAGAPFDLMMSSLGVKADLKSKELVIDKPALPKEMDEVTVKQIHYRGKVLNLNFKKEGLFKKIKVTVTDAQSGQELKLKQDAVKYTLKV